MISVIIPCYNMEEYLADCIESVLENNPEEVILVDDGSTDNSLNIAKQYSIKVISQVNKGLSSARNTGIMNATGEYCLFLDADDILMPYALEKIQEAIDKTNADIISGSLKTFGTTNENVILMENPTLEDFKIGNRIGSSSCVRRTKLLEVGGFSPRMVKGYEDMHLWINLLTRGSSIKTIQDIIWLYRTKEKSMFHDALANHEELMSQIKKDFPLW